MSKPSIVLDFIPTPLKSVYFYFVSFHSPGEALDIHDILKLTQNGVLDAPETERDCKAPQKETINDSQST